MPSQRPAAKVYLLGTIPHRELEALQRRLAYDTGDDPHAGAVILCQVAACVTVGRDGSAAHVRATPTQLTARNLGVSWVARGGGVHLSTPGQVTCLPVFAVEPLGLTPAAFVRATLAAAAEVVRSFGLDAERRPRPADGPGVRGRAVTMTGFAFRRGVSTGGVTVNVAPDLAVFRDFVIDGDPRPPTSLQRECVGPVRAAAVRQRLLDAICAALGVRQSGVLTHHPSALFARTPTRTPPHASEPARP